MQKTDHCIYLLIFLHPLYNHVQLNNPAKKHLTASHQHRRRTRLLPHSALRSHENQQNQYSCHTVPRSSQADRQHRMENLHERQVSILSFSSIAVARQAYGFTVYTQLLARLENQMANAFPNFNKVYHYSVSSVTAKLIAMVF